MSGHEYLMDIKKELDGGRRQRRMGENILAAFGFTRRRTSTVAEINRVMEELGIASDPPIDAQMPLRTPRVRFRLIGQSVPADQADTGISALAVAGDSVTTDEVAEEEAAAVEVLKEQLTTEQPALIEFRVGNFPSAEKDVECIAPDATVKNAYTVMRKNKYSQLVVAPKGKPRYSDVKGLISDRSITDAHMKGNEPTYVRECMEPKPPQVRLTDDIESVINQLGKNDIVLVTGVGDLLVGIITAWDLQNQFAGLAVPFSIIAEIESRLRIAVSVIGIGPICDLLSLQKADGYTSVSDLTLGELTRVLQNPALWSQLHIENYDREPFVDAVD